VQGLSKEKQQLPDFVNIIANNNNNNNVPTIAFFMNPGLTIIVIFL